MATFFFALLGGSALSYVFHALAAELSNIERCIRRRLGQLACGGRFGVGWRSPHLCCISVWSSPSEGEGGGRQGGIPLLHFQAFVEFVGTSWTAGTRAVLSVACLHKATGGSFCLCHHDTWGDSGAGGSFFLFFLCGIAFLCWVFVTIGSTVSASTITKAMGISMVALSRFYISHSD